MSWTSILPENLGFIEAFFTRLFLIFSLITIGPWIFFIFYDICLYLWRSAWHEIPYVGGRARGRRRPRAPSLVERPNGNPRRFTMSSRGSKSRPPTLADHSPIPEESPDSSRRREEKLAPLVTVHAN